MFHVSFRFSIKRNNSNRMARFFLTYFFCALSITIQTMQKIETDILVWFRSKDEVILELNIQNKSFASIKCWITNDSFRPRL